MPEDMDRSLEERLAAIERRLTALEERNSPPGETGAPAPPAAPPPAAPAAAPPVAAPDSAPPVVGRATEGPARRAAAGPRLSAALVLGWAGSGTLVLAAAYLVRLSIVYGWLTPTRQVVAAAVAGGILVGAGAFLRLRDRAYAGLLSAAGIAVLYLTVYGAHLHHRLIGAPAATGLVVATAALSLGLHAVFRGGPFVAFALAGSYSAPLLIPGEGSLADLAIYLMVWNLVYGIAALRLGSRAVYLTALFASLCVFEYGWSEGSATGAWQTAALFQLFQLAFFGAVVAEFSIRWKRPIEDEGLAALHGLALALLYFFEWRILDRYAPDLAPWAAATFAAALYGLWLATRRATGAGHAMSLFVVHAFGALVLVHAVWWEGIAREWRPLAALAMAVALWALPRIRPRLGAGWAPWRAAALVLLVLGWMLLVGNWLGSRFDDSMTRPVVGGLLLALWPAALYALYLRWPSGGRWPERVLTLGAAHVTALVGAALLVDRWLGDPDTTIERLWLSLAWGALAVGWLAASIPRADRMLARSTLAIFALFGGKVLLFDLRGEDSLVRVGVLAVLGAALYAGGWIYRRVADPRGPEP